ncbi:MAG TPA: sigma-70 family RNA polymerase sigma factor, partial [Gemmataceae bacterium]|nr:sigma-70 family RNA polymerase sigma factor [Gemmataceae bacterium]
MAKPILSDFLRRLARGMAAETLNEHSDRELVQKALDERDEASLQAIVNRHGPMVYRVCWRVLQHSQDAEDAFQATFLILAQKLRTVRKQASLASWLHGVAHRVALKARAQSATRRRREQRLQSPTQLPPDEVTWGELRSALDQELSRLPEKWRQPLILCYLEGRTQDESAGLLGWSKSTLRRRLHEARTALGGRLNERGIVLPAALSAVLLSECASSAALSPSILGSLVTSAAGVAAGKSLATISPRVVALMKGIRTTMILAKLKTTTAVVIFICLAVAGIGGAGLAGHGASPSSEQPSETNESSLTAAVSKPPESNGKQPALADEPGANTLRVVVLDPDGKPLPNAKVHASIWTKEKGFKANHDYQTDASGAVPVELPKTYY